MNISTELLIGIILILGGLILAFAAYMILSNRKEGDQMESSEEGMERGDLAEGTIRSDDSTPKLEVPQLAEIEGDEDLEEQDLPAYIEDSSEVGAEKELAEVVDKVPELEVDLQTPQINGSHSENDQVDSVSDPEIDTRRITIATLMRDEVTGELIVNVDDQAYLSSEELRASRHWTKVEYASSDLQRWLSAERAVGGSDEKESAQPTPRPLTMVEQINDVLQQKLVNASQASQAVRLIEGPGGTVRVLIGVQSYGIGEVPDPEVRGLIREAVAAWEENQ